MFQGIDKTSYTTSFFGFTVYDEFESLPFISAATVVYDLTVTDNFIYPDSNKYLSFGKGNGTYVALPEISSSLGAPNFSNCSRTFLIRLSIVTERS